MRRLFLLLLSLFLTPAQAIPVCNRSESVRKAIVEQIGLKCDQITAQHLESITSLTLHSTFLISFGNDLDGLVNLRVLDLSSSLFLFSDINAPFLKLETLILTNSAIRDELLTDLFRVTPHLRKLFIGQTESLERFVPFESLRHLPQLEELYIDGASIESLSWPVSKLSKLKVLSISRHGGLRRISREFLGTLPAIETLILRENPKLEEIPDFAFQDMKNLKRVEVQGSPLTKTRKAAFKGVPEVVGLPPDFDQDATEWGDR